MANKEQLNTLVSPAHRDLVHKIAAERGWTVNQTMRTAIETLGGVLVLHAATAEKLAAEAGEETGQLWARMVHEFDMTQLLNKELVTGVEVDGHAAIAADGFVFWIDDEDRLLAAKHVGDRQETYEVERGRLVVKAAFPAPDLSMN